MKPWLHIVGIGEDGLPGLTPAARAVVEAADVIVGGERHPHAIGREFDGAIVSAGSGEWFHAAIPIDPHQRSLGEQFRRACR